MPPQTQRDEEPSYSERLVERSKERQADKPALKSIPMPHLEAPDLPSLEERERERAAGVYSTSPHLRNRHQVFSIGFSHKELYQMLQFFERVAMLRQEHFNLVREAVLYREMLELRAKKQGF
jgi:hypothetical protein